MCSCSSSGRSALRGDRFILRDQSALRTLGGGTVIDAFAPETRRRREQRVAALDALERETPAESLAALLAQSPPSGIDARRFATLWNLPEPQWQAVLAQVPHRAIADGTRELLFSPAQLERYDASVNAQLAAHHQRKPDSPGLTQEQLQRAVRDKPAGALFAMLLNELVRTGKIKRSGPHLAGRPLGGPAGRREAALGAAQALARRRRHPPAAPERDAAARPQPAPRPDAARLRAPAAHGEPACGGRRILHPDHASARARSAGVGSRAGRSEQAAERQGAARAHGHQSAPVGSAGRVFRSDRPDAARRDRSAFPT
ncbi:hypothetical protein FSC37_04365 [Piscinibacter aquaticus]|uniref:Uncharacterized protein n=1 Tax=Piscinibacter aquaticus TaxID=392597 RepID=A0A5C6TY96_9BURK|nr:hypothetical protein FSC37_04365 [Piscinibacter aquaticus]